MAATVTVRLYIIVAGGSRLRLCGESDKIARNHLQILLFIYYYSNCSVCKIKSNIIEPI